MPTFHGGDGYGRSPRAALRAALVRRLVAKGCAVRKAERVAWRRYP